MIEPLNVMGCCSPDWNHEPFHCEGKTQFVAAEKRKRKETVLYTLISLYHGRKVSRSRESSFIVIISQLFAPKLCSWKINFACN
jgi:hypothetical protein